APIPCFPYRLVESGAVEARKVARAAQAVERLEGAVGHGAGGVVRQQKSAPEQAGLAQRGTGQLRLVAQRDPFAILDDVFQLRALPSTWIRLSRNELQMRLMPRTSAVVATNARCTVESIAAPISVNHCAAMTASMPVPVSARATPASRPASS